MEPISILDLQKQIQDIAKSNRNLAWFTILMFMIIISIYCVFANRGTKDPYAKEIQELQTAIAIQRATDSIIVQTLRKQDAEDSMRTQILLGDIARTQITLANITKRYDTKRTTVTNLSDTEQLNLLSDNITKGH